MSSFLPLLNWPQPSTVSVSCSAIASISIATDWQNLVLAQISAISDLLSLVMGWIFCLPSQGFLIPSQLEQHFDPSVPLIESLDLLNIHLPPPPPFPVVPIYLQGDQTGEGGAH